MIVVFLIVSFLLDGIVFSLLSIDSTCLPLFSLLSLLLMYPYCSSDKRKMYFSAIAMGVFYDIVYTNSLFLNTLLFCLTIYIIDKLFKYLTNNFVNTFIVSTIVICLYRILNYLTFIVLGMLSWNFNDVVISISHSLIINYVYVIVFYFLLYALSKRMDIKRNT